MLKSFVNIRVTEHSYFYGCGTIVSSISVTFLITIDKIKLGSEASFTKVYEAYHTRLYYYFCKKAKSTEAAKELTQLTFIKLWQCRHSLSEDIAFDKQLFTIAASVFIDYLRHQNTLSNQMICVDHYQSISLEAVQEEEAYLEFETKDYFNHITEALSPTRKKVFILSRVYGYSNKAIAAQLSISIKTVEDHIGKALKHIRTAGVVQVLLCLLLHCYY